MSSGELGPPWVHTVDGILYSGQQSWPFFHFRCLDPVQHSTHYGYALLHCSLLLTSSRHCTLVEYVHGREEVAKLQAVLAAIISNDH